MYDVINYIDCTPDQQREILALRNLDSVRVWMVNPEIIPESNHFQFVESLRANTNRLYFAIYKGGLLMGTYNLTKIGEGLWERGIIANPVAQGKGETELWERQILDQLSKYGIQNIAAKVKQDNLRSIRYHEKLGYQEQSRDNEFIYYTLRIMKKTFIIAELSANHNGSRQTAIDSVRAAKKAGADAIKIQTYTADTLTLNCDKPDFVCGKGLWEGETLYQLYQKAYTPWEWHEEIFRVAREEGLVCFSTPFDSTAVDLLESLDNPIYKIASFEITDIPLIRYIASKHKPIILSTGIAMEEDIQLAVDTIRAEGNSDITLLKCTSAYPAPIEDANLMTIPDMKRRFGVKVGLSDHTEGYTVPMAAVALGAEVVEKHFIIDRSIGGPDSAFSMEADEFKLMVDNIRKVESALGTVNYPTDPSKIKGREFSRSLYVAESMKAGDVITEKNIRSVRPGFGLHPKYLSELLGLKVNRDMEVGDRMSLDAVECD